MENISFNYNPNVRNQPKAPFPLFELDEHGEIKLDLEANLDDREAEIDILNFKPVSKGLGFHHQETLKAATALPKKNKTTITPEMRNAAVPLGKAPQVEKNFQSVTLTQEEISLLEKKTDSKTSLTNVQVGTQILAWVIDLFCITFLFAGTLALFSLMTKISWPQVMALLNPFEIAFSLGSLFVLYYLSYFTVLDLQQTPGKNILGLQLRKLDNGEVKVKETFTRALVSLCSFALLGLPLTLDFQGKISETKVVS